MIDRAIVDHIRHLVRPIANRVANTVARAVVHLVDDSTKLQLLQIGVLSGETIDGAEHFQPWGISGVPLPGSEAIVVFPNGDRSHPLVFAVSDRRHRPTGGDPGQFAIHNHTGATVILTKDGDIEVQPAAGRNVFIRDVGGAVDSLVTKTEFNAHTHPTAANGPASTPTIPATGTTVFKAQ